jgi:hypothetical protein
MDAALASSQRFARRLGAVDIGFLPGIGNDLVGRDMRIERSTLSIRNNHVLSFLHEDDRNLQFDD